jgi:single-strand DNA-binding protein
MSQDNHITLRGYLTAEPTLYQKTATATPVTEIRIGSTPRRLNRETGEWYDAPSSYFTVKCWRRLAVNAASSLHKGDMVVVRGRVYMSHWVDSQQRQQSRMEVEADSLGHDLSYGWSRFLRGTRSQADHSAAVNAGEVARQDVGSAAAGAGLDGQGLGPSNQGSSPARDASSAQGEGQANSGAAADGYSVAANEYSTAEDALAADDEYSAADPLAGESTLNSSALAVTESDGYDGLKPEDVLAVSTLTDVESLSEVERESEVVSS